VAGDIDGTVSTSSDAEGFFVLDRWGTSRSSSEPDATTSNPSPALANTSRLSLHELLTILQIRL
jgi:hypothetical protein